MCMLGLAHPHTLTSDYIYSVCFSGKTINFNVNLMFWYKCIYFWNRLVYTKLFVCLLFFSFFGFLFHQTYIYIICCKYIHCALLLSSYEDFLSPSAKKEVCCIISSLKIFDGCICVKRLLS
jgi:hypothetical protein